MPTPPTTQAIADPALVAHDLKNLLAVVLGHAELQSSRLEESGDELLLVSLKAIRLHAGRAASVCEDLLALASVEKAAVAEISLAELAETTTELFQDRSGAVLECLSPASKDVTVFGSRNAVGRALLNLVWNALDAVEGHDDGWIGLRWGEQENPWIEVVDNGPGLPEGELGNLVKAFHSTRTDGSQPRGLGLTLAALVMKEQGGRLLGSNRQSSSGAIMRLEFAKN
jgi:two-component system C4-dicarboxylate transport sensor histidine kinase DctB